MKQIKEKVGNTKSRPNTSKAGKNNETSQNWRYAEAN